MSNRLASAGLAAAFALSLASGAASAQTYAPPANVPTAAALGASASPLVGQGYLPSANSREHDAPIGTFRTDHRSGGWQLVR